MNMDDFESYALGKGFTFEKIYESENQKGNAYGKGKGENTKYLIRYTKFFGYGETVSYQTHNSTDALNFKNQMKTLGFALYEEDTIDGAISKSYRNGKYDINIISGKNEMNGNSFEITLYKY